MRKFLLSVGFKEERDRYFVREEISLYQRIVDRAWIVSIDGGKHYDILTEQDIYELLE